MMQRKHLMKVSTQAALLSSYVTLGACALEPGALEAGLNGSEGSDGADGAHGASDETSCMIGTEVDTVGTQTSIQMPPCEVVCDDGWGHDGDQLPIVWTKLLHEDDLDISSIGLIALASGEVRLLTIPSDGPSLLHAIDLDTGETEWTAERELPLISVLTLSSGASQLYAMGRSADMTQFVYALGLDGSLLWSRDFGVVTHKPAMASGPLGVVVVHENRLELLTHDGELVWDRSAPSSTNAIAIGPAPASNIAVAAGDKMWVYGPDSGALLWTAPLFDSALVEQVAFTGQDRLVAVGLAPATAHLDAAISTFDQGDAGWYHLYNRALSWCPHLGEAPGQASSAEVFHGVTVLGDGSLVVVGTEHVAQDGEDGTQMWVGHVGIDGELLAFDRGHWTGRGLGVATGADGSALVLGDRRGDASGLMLRKYAP